MEEEYEEEQYEVQVQPTESDVRADVSKSKSNAALEIPKETWSTLMSTKMNDLYLVAKYRNNLTKMDVVHANIFSPYISCYCVIPHKLEDDFGFPHILQHMIFQGGSKAYPLSGLLQTVSNRSFSSGLKSWTERDHSCYYFTTAGKAGFEQLLPVVFDHIFHPHLQEATFLQEVYHVQGDGTEYGTCLKEMIRLECDPETLATQELIKTALGLSSTYIYSHSGSSDLLREQDLKLVNKVKKFHEKFYHLSNCCLIICGDISKQELLPLLENVCSTVTSKKRKWKKPWKNEPVAEPPQEPLTSYIDYPCSDANQGVLVKIGIIGPPSTEKLNRCVAMRLVLEYLVHGPLFESLVLNKPSSSGGRNYLDNDEDDEDDDNIHFAKHLTVSQYELKQTLFCINCHNVHIKMVPKVKNIVRRAIEQHLIYDLEFDNERMVQIVDRFYNEELSALETKMEEKICRNIISDFLYANQDSDLMFDRRVNSAYTIHHFLNQPQDFWMHVIRECILEANWVTIRAIPKKELADELLAADVARQKERLEPEKIKDTKRLAQRYKAALKLFASQKKTGEGSPLEQFSLPPVDSIGFTHIAPQANPKWAEDTLCNLYVDDVNSCHVFLTIIMDTSELTMEEKKYLLLFREGLSNSPCIDTLNQFHSAEEMGEYLSRDCLKYETFFGLEWLGRLEDRTRFVSGSFPHLFCLRFQLDTSKIKEGFYWAQNLLWNTRWQADKLKMTCQKLVLEVDKELKRSGPVMTQAMLTDSFYLMNSVPKAVSLIRQKMFLQKVGNDLPKNIRKVAKVLEGIRMTLLRPENCTVHVAGSLSKMEFNLSEDPNAKDAIAQLLRATFDYTGWHWGYNTRRLSNSFNMYSMRSTDCIAKCSREQILRMENAEMGYLIQATPGLKSWADQDYPFLLTTLQYFIQVEGGPLYMELVSKGYAEQIDIRISPSEGLVYFEMRKCKDIAQAYERAFEIMSRHCPKESSEAEGAQAHVWDENLLISAKSSMIFRLTLEESTPQQMAMLSLLGYYKGVDQIGHVRRHLMEKIVGTTMDKVSHMTFKYLKPLFLQPCTCAASVPEAKAISTIQSLMVRCGKRLTLIPPLEHSALASYNQ